MAACSEEVLALAVPRAQLHMTPHQPLYIPHTLAACAYLDFSGLNTPTGAYGVLYTHVHMAESEVLIYTKYFCRLSIITAHMLFSYHDYLKVHKVYFATPKTFVSPHYMIETSEANLDLPQSQCTHVAFDISTTPSYCGVWLTLIKKWPMNNKLPPT